MPKFLSDEWFVKIDELTAAAAGLEIPKAMKDVVVNLKVDHGDGEVAMCMDGGIIKKGHAPKADVDMSMPAEYALSIIVRGDWSAGMKGWVARRINSWATCASSYRCRYTGQPHHRRTSGRRLNR